MGEYPAGIVSTLSTGAVYDDLAVSRNFLQPGAKLVERNMKRILDSAPGNFCVIPDIKKKKLAKTLTRFRSLDWRDKSLQNINPNHAGDVDRVLSRSERRGIAQFKFCQVKYRHLGPNRCSNNIDPFINAVASRHLGSKHKSVLRRKQQLYRQRLGPGKVAGVRGTEGMNRLIASSAGTELPFISPGASGNN